MTIEMLNEKFGINSVANFYTGQGGLNMLSITNQYGAASISLYGGQLLSYTPAEEKDLLWLSKKSLFENGKAIRGGVPVCFPWFGPHPEDKTKPQHGFARLQEWEVINVISNEDGATQVSIQLTENPGSLALWPFPFNATLDFTIGKSMEIKLTVVNTGTAAFEYSDALHSYYNISDIDSIKIKGLHEATYYDGFDMELKVQDAASLHFEAAETNRRYVNHFADCIIHDDGFKREIIAGKTGSKVTVVWNPAEAVSANMGDMATDGYKTFVCVEPANAYLGIDMIVLQPGESHTLTATMSCH